MFLSHSSTHRIAVQASNMLCAVCETIPLDLFLPTTGCGHTYHDGYAWLGSMHHSRQRDVQQSGANGCVMCRMLLAALDTDRSMDGIPPEARPQETSVSLRCVGEGKLRVFEHSEGYPIRTGNLYWFNEGTNLGRRPGESAHDLHPLLRASELITRHNQDYSVAKNPSSLPVFLLAESWIEGCRNEHVACTQRRDDSFAPTRLIDIGSATKDAPITPRLILGSICEVDEYLALSHCWGTASGEQVPKTTNENLAERMVGIRWDELSKTFQDSLVIARRLGLRYIWIDSLCIIQDSDEDFEIECARMGQVYLNAVCTIAVRLAPNSSMDKCSTLAGLELFRRQWRLLYSPGRSSCRPVRCSLLKRV